MRRHRSSLPPRLSAGRKGSAETPLCPNGGLALSTTGGSTIAIEQRQHGLGAAIHYHIALPRILLIHSRIHLLTYKRPRLSHQFPSTRSASPAECRFPTSTAKQQFEIYRKTRAHHGVFHQNLANSPDFVSFSYQKTRREFQVGVAKEGQELVVLPSFDHQDQLRFSARDLPRVKVGT